VEGVGNRGGKVAVARDCFPMLGEHCGWIKLESIEELNSKVEKEPWVHISLHTI